MKNKEKLAMFEPAEGYINEACPKKRKAWSMKAFISIAACICILVTAVELVLFLPYNTQPPDVSKYESSEYYGIIQRLNEANFTPPSHKNLFMKLSSAINRALIGKVYEDKTDGAAPGVGDAANEGYVEVTDNQVKNVTEGDLVKRSESTVYFLNANVLYVYPIAGMDTQKGGRYELDLEDKNNTWGAQEIYLSRDCTRVTVICHKGSLGSMTAVITLDVTDMKSIRETERIYIDGQYISSREINGDLLLITRFEAADADYSDPSTFVPAVGTESGEDVIPPENIIYPEVLSDTGYTVVTKIDGETSKHSTFALLSYCEDVYVTETRLYAYRNYARNDAGERMPRADIACIDLENDLSFLGGFTVDGRINNRYSIDEYEGVVRLFTTGNVERETEYTNYLGEKESHKYYVTNCNLFCIDSSTFEEIASVRNFAPDTDTVKSARFDKNTAYVCTAVEITDPVFFFDLSDLSDITYKSTEEIRGFSTSLVDFGEYLIGIGTENGSDLKVEVYKEEDKEIIPLSAYRMNALYADDYKSYLIDRERGLVGIPVMSWDMAEEKYFYLLLHFDGTELSQCMLQQIQPTGLNTVRGLYIDGLMYVFCNDSVRVIQPNPGK